MGADGSGFLPQIGAMSEIAPTGRRPRVVIVGAGFGGLAAARALARAPVDVIVVDRRNYHLFQPLLYQVATAGLSPSDVAWPIRGILARQRNASVLLARVTGIDTAGRCVVAEDRRIPYDWLILATGARHAYFGHDEWEPFAPGLKKIEDATALRRRILLAFEHAELAESEEERRRLLTFVIVGAGPTGVEMAGAIVELARRALAADFRRIDPRASQVILVEAGPRVLPAFTPASSASAAAQLARLGVEVRTGAAVTACDADGVALGAERIAAGTVIWAAGVAASSAARWLDAAHDRAGRIKVGPDLGVPLHANVFAIGDTVALTDAAGRAVPGVAPAAKQQGQHVARLIQARLAGAADPPPFRYRDYGALATIGRKAAVAELGRLRLSGFLAWWIWSVAHIAFLVDARSRFSVLLNWAWSYLTFKRGARLITGG